MPTQDWMNEVTEWAARRDDIRARIREGTKEDSPVYEGGNYAWNLLIAIDQLGNAIFGGNADETISSRIGKAKLRGDLSAAGYALDVMLNAIDANHSIDAIEEDEGVPIIIVDTDFDAKTVTFENEIIDLRRFAPKNRKRDDYED